MAFCGGLRLLVCWFVICCGFIAACFLVFLDVWARCDVAFVCVNSVVFAVILFSCGVGLMWVGLVWCLLWVVFVCGCCLLICLFDVGCLVLLLFTCLWLC